MPPRLPSPLGPQRRQIIKTNQEPVFTRKMCDDVAFGFVETAACRFHLLLNPFEVEVFMVVSFIRAEFIHSNNKSFQ